MDVNETYCNDHFTIYTYNKSLCCSETNTSYVNLSQFKKSVVTYSWQRVRDWCHFCTEVFCSSFLSVNLEGESFESTILLDTNFSHFTKLCVHLLPPGLSLQPTSPLPIITTNSLAHHHLGWSVCLLPASRIQTTWLRWGHWWCIYSLYKIGK